MENTGQQGQPQAVNAQNNNISRPNADQQPTNPTNPNDLQRYKSKTRMIIIGLIISLSALTFGYSLKEITSVPIATLMIVYNIPIASSAAQSLLIGIQPFGACFGAAFTVLLMKRARRLTGIYIFTVVIVVGIGLVNVGNFICLVIGRFIEGVAVGFYSALTPVYLRQIAPKQLRSLMGLFFSFGKIIGVLLVIAVELILDAVKVSYGWRIILSMTAVFSVLQTVLIKCFGTDTPVQLIEKDRMADARQIVEYFYKQQFAEAVYQQYVKDYEMELAKEGKIEQIKKVEAQFEQQQSEHAQKMERQSLERLSGGIQPNQLSAGVMINTENLQGNEVGGAKQDSNIIKNVVQNNKNAAQNQNQNIDQNEAQNEVMQDQTQEIIREHKKDQNANPAPVSAPANNNQENRAQASEQIPLQQKKRSAYILAINLSILRQFIGGNTVLTQSGLFITPISPVLGHYTTLIINLVQFVAIVVGMIWVPKVTGKRNLFLCSVSILILLNFGIAISMIKVEIISLFIQICFFMIVFGGGFISPVWAYPSQIIPASQALIPNICHWLALAISTLIPPIVAGKMDNNPWPCYFFYGAYGIFGLIHIQRKLVESDGYTYEEIIKRFT